LSVTVGELLEVAGPALQLRLVSSAHGLAREITVPRLQQPGLALAGYLPQLHPDRVQVLGNSEVSYLGTLEAARARAGVAVLGSALRTADFIRAASAWLEERLAPEMLLHGDLVEVHGLGVLILGKSGIGKSEAALDLISRGHRLVADDVVHVRRISPTELRGRAAPLLEHHMEIRGLGVIDIEALFGTLATLDERRIDFVVELTEWPGKADRLGLVEEQHDLLEMSLPMVRIPVRPGRSIAMLIETAARNSLLRRRGRHSARGFSERLDREIAGRGAERRGGKG